MTNYLIILLFFFGLSLEAQTKKPFALISPKPSEEWLSPNEQILIKLNSDPSTTIENCTFGLVGDKQGIYPNKAIYLAEDQTFLIKALKSFLPGESITVTINIPPYDQLSYKFKVRDYNIPANVELTESSLNSAEIQPERASALTVGLSQIINGVGIPSDFPRINTYVNDTTAPGYLFLGNWGGSQYMLIFRNDGTPYFYKRTAEHIRDFKVQGNGYLTCRVYGGIQGNVMMDSAFNYIDTINCVGYETDEHECQISADGHILLIALDYKTVDMSKLVPDGDTNATAIGNHIQELDKNHNLVFEWRCWDNFDILGAEHEDLTSNRIDYIHMNSLAYDYDSNIVCSSRHLSECTKINRKTGEIMWRLGGKYNQFTYLNGATPTSYQHDFRPVPGKPNHYTVFDNGNFRENQYTRVVEYKIDPENYTIEQVWEYRHNPDRYTSWMGNAQRLPNGNTLINWADGSLPKATEVTTEGQVVYDMGFEGNFSCYRTFRFEWTGKSEEPYLIAENVANGVNLIFNKFGDNKVAHYNIYGDTLDNPTTFLKSSSEPIKIVYELNNNEKYYFRVTAVDSSGHESPYSNTESAIIKFQKPGENKVINGDFSVNLSNWHVVVNSGGANGVLTSENEYQVQIYDPSDDYWKIQLIQEPVALIKDKTYRFDFDCYAAKSRIIEPKIEQRSGLYINYSKIGPISLSTQHKHFSYTFTMSDATDNEAGIVFCCGKEMGDVFVDNVSLIDISGPCSTKVDVIPIQQPQQTSYNLALSITNAVFPVVYYLNDKFALVSNSPNDTIYNIQKNKYTLGFIDGTGCYSTREIDLITRIQENPIGPLIFAVFPNPAQNILQLKFTEDQIGCFEIDVYNTGGKCMMSKEISLRQGEITNELNISNLPIGSYVISCRNQEKQITVTQKFIKTK